MVSGYDLTWTPTEKCDYLTRTLRLRLPATADRLFSINTADADFLPSPYPLPVDPASSSPGHGAPALMPVGLLFTLLSVFMDTALAARLALEICAAFRELRWPATSLTANCAHGLLIKYMRPSHDRVFTVCGDRSHTLPSNSMHVAVQVALQVRQQQG